MIRRLVIVGLGLWMNECHLDLAALATRGDGHGGLRIDGAQFRMQIRCGCHRHRVTPFVISIGIAHGTLVYGINNKGQMVGDYLSNGVTWGFVGYEGNLGYNYTPIDVLGATGTVATCINGKGLIGGYYLVGSVEHGFVYNGSTYTAVDDPNYANNEVTGINNKGWVAGIGIDSLGLGRSWIEYRGNFYTVADPASTGATLVEGINNHDHVVGTILLGTTTAAAFIADLIFH